jgi:hypothetical protein
MLDTHTEGKAPLDVGTGVLVPTTGTETDGGVVEIALVADKLGLAAAAMLNCALVAKIWLILVMLTNSRVYWSL